MTEQRPIWRGQLRLALVSCPVALYSANHEHGNLHFNLINPKTGNRIRMITEDTETGDELSRSDLVRGFEYQKGHYLTLTDEDFDSARIDSSETMTVEKFVDASAIDPIYFDSSYYLTNDGKSGADVYLVLREAIAKSGKIALSRVVIARRERIVALRPLERGLAMHTLHEQRDLNSAAKAFDDVPKEKPDPEMVKLAQQLIERQSGAFDPADFEDRYESRLRVMIEAKLKGKGIEPEPAAEQDRGNVIDLMDALRQSLGGRKEQKKRSTTQTPAKAKATTKRPTKRRA